MALNGGYTLTQDATPVARTVTTPSGTDYGHIGFGDGFGILADDPQLLMDLADSLVEAAEMLLAAHRNAA